MALQKYRIHQDTHQKHLNLLVNKYGMPPLSLQWCTLYFAQALQPQSLGTIVSFIPNVIIVDLALESNKLDAITQLLLAVLHLPKLYI